MRKLSEQDEVIYIHGIGCGISDYNGAAKECDGDDEFGGNTTKPPPTKP